MREIINGIFYVMRAGCRGGLCRTTPAVGTIYRWFAAWRDVADSGYAGEKVAKATFIAVEIVRKNPDQVGFAVNPRRWVVERFFVDRAQSRLAKDFEATIYSARAFLYAASVMLLVRRIARAL